MAKSLPPLTWFRAFEAAARCLSFTAAAQEIGMTQSAVSQHVKALELRLGVSLFVRRARGLSLTDEGRKLLPQVGTALETLAQATRRYETGQGDNLLTIACSVSVAQWVIAPHLASFRDRAPDVRLRFVGTIWPDEFHALRADVEIPFGSEKQVGQEGVLLEPSALIPLRAPTLEGPLDNLPLIEAVGTSDGWAKWQKQVSKVGQPDLFVDSYGAALHMAVHGNGVALVSALLAQTALQSGQLVPAHPASLPATEGYYLRTNPHVPAAEQFRDWLFDHLGHVSDFPRLSGTAP
ncbi:LysR family transcriptional regulator [uncultured Tateyamaria sp.]|uniref:LysR family transcriptional regulator n=1 Tax=uncultured Tateyamaria sp. TaxID=455651 RepID=UPI0026037A71|nr:LysR family transcriptional regulator [uncultured Tateyamaria sp.]